MGHAGFIDFHTYDAEVEIDAGLSESVAWRDNGGDGQLFAIDCGGRTKDIADIFCRGRRTALTMCCAETGRRGTRFLNI